MIVLFAIQIICLLDNAFIIFKLRPIYNEHLKHLQNEQELEVQKVELLLADFKNRVTTKIYYD